MKKNKRNPHPSARPSPLRASFIENNVPVLLSTILATALLVRVLALLGFSGSIYSGFLVWDEGTYHDWAVHLLQGKIYFAHEFGPLPAYVMAAVYWLFSADPVYVRALNIIFGVLTCLFIYFIGRDLANRAIGLLACLIAALYKPFIFFSILILKESLALFLFSLAICSFVSLTGKSPQQRADPPEGARSDAAWSYGKVLVLGAALGWLINVRQNVIVLLPVFLLSLLWNQYKRSFPARTVLKTAAVYAFGLCLAIAPFLVHNYRASGEYKVSAPGGFNLYMGNTPDNPYPYYRPVQFATSIPSQQVVQFVIEASRRAGKRLSPEEASSYWIREVLRIAQEHPGQTAWKLWQKTLLVVNQSEEEDNYDLGFISRFVPFLRLPFFAYWFIGPLSIAAFIFSIRNGYRSFALAVVAAVYALTMIAFFTSMRIRIPLLVILIPYAAIGLSWLSRVVKGAMPRTEARSFLAVIAILAAVAFLPVEGTGDLSGHYNTHAINLVSKGMGREAVRYWEESSAMERPYSAYANLSLADVHFRSGNVPKGLAYANKISDASFAAANKYEVLGDIYEHQGLVDRAARAYERSLAINSGQIRPRTKLIGLYEQRDPERAEKERERLLYIKSFYPADS